MHPLPHMGKIPFDFGARTSHETLGVVSHVPFEKYIEREREGGRGRRVTHREETEWARVTKWQRNRT